MGFFKSIKNFLNGLSCRSVCCDTVIINSNAPNDNINVDLDIRGNDTTENKEKHEKEDNKK